MRFRSRYRKLGYILGSWKARLLGASVEKGVRIALGAEIDIWSGGAIRIGAGSVVHSGVKLRTYPGGQITIGKDCSINPYCVLYGHGGLTLGDGVRVAAHTVMIPANHRFSDALGAIRNQGLDQQGIIIGNDVWIGAGVRILDGVTIGDGCVIAAGAVMNRSTTDRGVYAGVPAKLVKRR